MATRSRRASGSRTSAATNDTSDATSRVSALASQAVNVPAGAAKAAWEAWSQFGKTELSVQIDAAQALLRSAQILREAQLDANQKAQAAHVQAAEQVATINNLNDVVGVQLSLLRDDLQGAMNYWSRISEVATAAGLDSWARSAEGVARLSNSLWSSALQWTQLAQTDAPAAAEELEASVDHLMNPMIASPMLWPTQEAAREAMTLASSALNDWFSWSGMLQNGATRVAEQAAGPVH